MPGRRLYAHWLIVRPGKLRLFFGIDAIFLYQFGVYLAVWLWAIWRQFLTEHPPLSPLFLFAPPVVFVGYLIPKKWGVIMCAAGDAAMAWGTVLQAWSAHKTN